MVSDSRFNDKYIPNAEMDSQQFFDETRVILAKYLSLILNRKRNSTQKKCDEMHIC